MSELISKDTHERLDRVEQQLEGLSGEFARLSLAALTDQQKFKILEEMLKRHEDEIREIKILFASG